MAGLAHRIARSVVLLLAGLVVAVEALALQVTSSEAGDAQLGLRISSIRDDSDAVLARKLMQAVAASETDEAGSYTVARSRQPIAAQN